MMRVANWLGKMVEMGEGKIRSQKMQLLLQPLEERTVPDATQINPTGYTPYDSVGSGVVTLEYRPTPGTDDTVRTLIMPIESGGVAVSLDGAQGTYVLYTTNNGVDDTGPLSSQDARYLQLLLEGLAKNGKLSPAQLVEFKKLIDRFNEDGLEADDVKKIEQLGKLIEGIQKVTDKLGVDKVANQLDYIETMIGHILEGLKKVKNA